jgi:hypothetical protein
MEELLEQAVSIAAQRQADMAEISNFPFFIVFAPRETTPKKRCLSIVSRYTVFSLSYYSTLFPICKKQNQVFLKLNVKKR